MDANPMRIHIWSPLQVIERLGHLVHFSIAQAQRPHAGTTPGLVDEDSITMMHQNSRFMQTAAPPVGQGRGHNNRCPVSAGNKVAPKGLTGAGLNGDIFPSKTVVDRPGLATLARAIKEGDG